MPAMDSNSGGIQKIVAGGARPGLIFRRDSFFFRRESRQNAGLEKPCICLLNWSCQLPLKSILDVLYELVLSSHHLVYLQNSSLFPKLILVKTDHPA